MSVCACVSVSVCVGGSLEFRTDASVPAGVSATSRLEAGGKVLAVPLACEKTTDVKLTLQF